MRIRNFVDQSVWDDGYRLHNFAVADRQDRVRRWLEGFLINHPARHGMECLEVGCFPGQYLAVLGDYGFRLSGIDATPRTNTELDEWLRSSGYAVGQIIQGDFFGYRFKRQFDLVYSLGFIEHFGDWRKVIRRHMCLVKPGGYLILSTPNFRGLAQCLYHWLFDRRNLFRHNLQAMDPRKWSELLKAGFEVLECGHFGGVHFWSGSQVHSRMAGIVLRAIGLLEDRLSSHLQKSMAFYAPFCGLIARKKG